MHLGTDRKRRDLLIDARRFWRLPPHQLDTLLALTRQADHVELKLVVPPDAHPAVCASLGVDLDRRPARRVYYLDTPDLALERHGVVARVRSVEKRRADCVIKLRPVTPRDLPGRLRKSKRVAVEVDAMPGQFVCSAAMKRRLRRGAVDRALADGRPLHTLFSAPQRALLRRQAPAGLDLDDLTVFGPVDVRRVKIFPAGLGHRLAVERWTYPDGSRLLEVSTRCAARDVVPVTAGITSLLRDHHIDTSGSQQTKTRTTLAYFHYARRRHRGDRR